MESVRWPQALAWRMRRQFLDPPADVSAVDVVRRLAGVQAQVASSAQLAVAVRQDAPRHDVDEALAWRSLVKTWAMRGTLHLLPADEAGAYLALAGSVRTWERPVWQRTVGAGPAELESLTAAVAEALDNRVLTREELATEVLQRTRLPDLEEKLRSGWAALFKPLAWQGYLCQGPPDGNRVTFTRPDTWLPAWPGVPDPDEAAPTVLRGYLRAYGPATMAAFDAWLTRGQSRKRQLRSWLEALGDELAPVDVDGEHAYVLAEDLDGLCAQQPTGTVRLLPGFDQYVLGPGTGAAPVVPPEHRAEVSRKSGWISPVVVAGGRVAGVWQVDGGTLEITLFEGVPRESLESETARIADLVSRDLRLVVAAES